MNIYYRDCLTRRDQRIPLVLFYPRVSILETSCTRLHSRGSMLELSALFRERYGSGWRDKFKDTVSGNTYGVWGTKTKQARVFTRYCALIVCNDGIVVGSDLQDLIT